MLVFILHARLWVHRAPGIPCALHFSGRMILARLGRDQRRENAELCDVIASTVASTVGWAKRSVPTIQDEAIDFWWARRKRAFAHPTNLRPTYETRSPELRPHLPQTVQLHRHMIAGVEPDRLDEAPGEHDLPGVQAFAFSGK